MADRVVMAAAKIVLEPIFEADFHPSSYGFRPGLSGHHALEAIRQTVTWLRAGVFEGGIVSATPAGTPQGSPLSPLLANVALHVLDQAWQGGGQRLGELVKYADDLVVLCATRERAEEALELVAAVLDGLGLRLHPEKTRIVHLAMGAEGFTFLGFEHRMRESWKQPGRWYLHKWPSRRAMASVRGKISDRSDRRYARLPLEWAVEDLKPRSAGLGQLLPLRKLRAEVLPHRRLRQRTPGDPRQRQARTTRPKLGLSLHL